MPLSASAARCSGGGRDGSRVSRLGLWGMASGGFPGASFRRGFHVVVVVDVVVVYAAVAAVVAAALALSGRTPGRFFFFVSFLSLRWRVALFRLRSFFSGCRCTGVVRRRRP